MSAAAVGTRLIGKQVVLPWRKAVEISLDSLRVRFSRSLITASSIALATAFVAYVAGQHGLLQRLLALGDPEVNFALQRHGIDLDAGDPGLAAREAWMIGTSIIVCFVGVWNALLMSVTERIKEIGTMKCLGALNAFVVRLFLIEALFMGALSAAGGGLAGVLASLLAGALSFGPVALHHAPWMRLAGIAVSVAGLGTALSVLAAIYPSLIAARMQPVEAMRREV